MRRILESCNVYGNRMADVASRFMTKYDFRVTTARDGNYFS